MYTSTLVLSSMLIAHTLGASLPPGITACKNDNKLNDCVLKNSKNAIQTLAKGNAKYGIPVLDPLYIERMDITEPGTKSISMNVSISQVNIHGLSKSIFVKSEMDTKKMKVHWKFRAPRIQLLSDYVVNGKFLVVPIVGKGRANITLDNFNYDFTFEYTLQDKKGAKYAVMKKPKITYTVGKGYVHLSNLFNGDKLLGENMNRLLNENWEDFNAALGPGIVEGIGQIIENILKNLLKLVPYAQIFA